MNSKTILTLLLGLVLTACFTPVDAPPPPTALPIASPQQAISPSPTATAIPTLTQTPTPTHTPAPAFCNDPRGLELITSLAEAVAAKDGELLASLVSPSRGLDVRFYRAGNAINYDAEQARFLFETTYQADWGLSFGSGEPTVGSFQEVILPSLSFVLSAETIIACDELKTGSATYIPDWPYPGLDFYSVHYAGTDQYSGLDWQTWAMGMDLVDGKPYLATLVHYVWEP